MSNKSGISDQVLSLPKGGGALKGIGEKFQPDPHTGTGNFSIPIAVPSGRNGFQPELSINYSTGNGNGSFGLGWQLSIPNVMRKTSKGIPKYRDNVNNPEEWDIFILSGAEDLVPVALWKYDGNAPDSKPLKKIENPTEDDYAQADVVQFRPRTEGIFARILFIRNSPDGKSHWEVTSKSGIRSIYGYTDECRVFDGDREDHVFQWLLCRTEDPNGNTIIYHYKKEDGSGLEDKEFEGSHQYNQTYLSRIEYVNYRPTGGLQDKHLFSIEFDYSEYDDAGNPTKTWEYRPDPFSFYKAGFEIRTVRRCKQILVKVHEEGDDASPIKSYDLSFITSEYNRVSLLQSVELNGYRRKEKESGDPESGVLDDGKVITEKYRIKSFPPIEFNYTIFEPEERTYQNLTAKGDYLPERALTDPEYEMIDLNGYGLPGIIRTTRTGHSYWRNLGNGHLDFPKPLHPVPAGVTLADDGVQFADMEGNGRSDLLVSNSPLSGYYPTTFEETWDRASFQAYDQAPSFNLKDPNVKLVDMDGDGVIDVLRTSYPHFEIYYNRGKDGWDPAIQHLPRRPPEEFPDVYFGALDGRVRLADMSGDGTQDIVLIHNGRIDYWPHMGYGKYGRRITLRNTPHLGYDFDPKRILLADIDGGGYSDLIYVDYDKVIVCINQSGNGWSDPIVIPGTPSITDMDSVRAADMLGNGTAGILWSYDHQQYLRSNYKFLDLTGGIKPYLLSEMSNNIGATTKVEYRPSTRFYLEDREKGIKWKTHLPFPVQCVARVEVIDHISRGKLVTRYAYHHGYWDGEEREFRGFGMVEQFDTETFEDYHKPGLHGEGVLYASVEEKHFTKPTRTRTWFHQGVDIDENPLYDFSDEFWSGDPDKTGAELRNSLSGKAQRDAYRAFRGSILRTELYALDGSAREGKPYTVTQNRYFVREEGAGSPPGKSLISDQHLFLPYQVETINTQWERGDDPMINRTEFVEPDSYGRQTEQTRVGKPRQGTADTQLSLKAITHYATLGKQDIGFVPDQSYQPTYIVDRVCEMILQNGAGKVVGHTQNFYDGQDFQGLDLGKVTHGNPMRTHKLALDATILNTAYSTLPTLLRGETFGLSAENLPKHHYTDDTGINHPDDKFWVQTVRNKYKTNYGMVERIRDPRGNDATIAYDKYDLFPTCVEDALKLTTEVDYDYEALAPSKQIDPNRNETEYAFDALGLVNKIAIKGKRIGDGWEGDTLEKPTILYRYDLHSFRNGNGPIFFRTYQREEHEGDETFDSVEYFDGFGRSIQKRVEAEPDPATPDKLRFVVSGWQVYNNKGWVVEKYEPLFSKTDDYQEVVSVTGNKITMLYDPLGRAIKTINPDSSFQQVIYGEIDDSELDKPDEMYKPDPWMAFFYDENDNAARAKDESGNELFDLDTLKLQDHVDTPKRETYDVWGRLVEVREHNVKLQPDGSKKEFITTRYEYDILGNLIKIIDVKNRDAFVHVFDLLGSKLRVENIDAGLRTFVFDAAGDLIEKRDGKESATITLHDEINRPLKVWARDDADQPISMREIYEYTNPSSDPADDAIERERNRLGRVAAIYDGAGKLTFDNYDFKGNLRLKNRRVIKDGAISDAFGGGGESSHVVNWGTSNPEDILDDQKYSTEQEYDALNRVITIKYPDGTLVNPKYNNANLLEKIEVAGEPYVKNINYNEKGQRTLIVYGNDVQTTYEYDPRTFRLKHLHTLKNQGSGETLQDLNYDYDLVGNIIILHDRTPNSGLPAHPNELDRTFTYDPLYRLLSATGREHDASISIPWDHKPRCADTDPRRCVDFTRAQGYEQEYQYDPVGNLRQLNHIANHGGFTRVFTIVPGNNRLETMTIDRKTYTYHYDDNGNLIQENEERHFAWDHADRLIAFRNQPEGSSPTLAEVRHLYGADGMRVKKWVRKNNSSSNDESTVYIDGIFEHHRWKEDGETKENNYLHVMDDQQRIALLRRGPAHPDDAGPEIQYHLGDHLGSNNVVIDGGGDWINREEYFPYGETSFGSFAMKRYRFTGNERDEESELNYHGARYYAPWLGRWLSCDPVGMVDELSLYIYVHGNPLRLIDTLGAQSTDPSAAEIAARTSDPVLHTIHKPAPMCIGPPRRSLVFNDQEGLLVDITDYPSINGPLIGELEAYNKLIEMRVKRQYRESLSNRTLLYGSLCENLLSVSAVATATIGPERRSPRELADALRNFESPEAKAQRIIEELTMLGGPPLSSLYYLASLSKYSRNDPQWHRAAMEIGKAHSGVLFVFGQMTNARNNNVRISSKIPLQSKISIPLSKNSPVLRPGLKPKTDATEMDPSPTPQELYKAVDLSFHLKTARSGPMR